MDFEYEINKWWVSNGDKLIEYADAIIFLLFLIAVLYIFIFSLASLKKMKNKYPPARKKYRFAVLFPAYQEDAVIINSVCSFMEQDYPSYMYELIVIADKMLERTMQTLKALPSITVLEVQYAQSTKTNALRLAMDYLIFSSLLQAVRKMTGRRQEQKVFLGGTKQLLNQPEFRDVERVRNLLGILEEEKVLKDLLQGGEDSGLRVTIGSENKFTGIQDCSMVQATYRLNGQIVGTMAVLGPTRMEYGKVISVMDYLHKYLKTILDK